MMNVLLIWILLVVQLVSLLSLGRAQSTTNQPDDGDQQHQVSAQIELETTVDDVFFPSDQSVVGSMETDATYHRQYYYPTNYNTYTQNIRRPYYFNRYPQNNNYRPAYRPTTYTPGAGYLNNVFSSIISQALASGNPIEHNIDLNNKGNYDNIAVSLLNQAQAAGVPLIYNPNVDISDK